MSAPTDNPVMSSIFQRPTSPFASEPETLYRWRVKARLPERQGTLCRVIARGKMNTCEVEFIDDGYRVYTSRNYLVRADRPLAPTRSRRPTRSRPAPRTPRR